MVAPDQSNSIVHAATHGTPQRDNYDATSPRPNGLSGPAINGAPPPFSRQCDMDVVCVGTWISNTGSQHTDSFSGNVRADATRAACVCHHSLHQACLESTTYTRVVECVAELKIDGLAKVLVGVDEGKSAVLVCTCEGFIEAFDHEDSQSVNVEEGAKTLRKSGGRKE